MTEATDTSALDPEPSSDEVSLPPPSAEASPGAEASQVTEASEPSETSAPRQAAGPERDVIIEVRGVTKRFDQEGTNVQVLNGIDLEIRNGEMICIQGRSGAGKSTLLHILGTLDLPTSGEVRYHGRNVTRFNSRELAKFRNATIGFVFQFHHLLPEFDALENVMMPGLVQGRPRPPLRKRALDLLTSVGLAHRTSHRPGELSGGEQQRVALARALVMHPKVILADEPTGNLDTATSDAMFKLFFELNRDLGTTFVIVTHSDDLAERMPRRIVMSDGLIAADLRRESPYRSASDHPSATGAEPGASLDPL